MFKFLALGDSYTIGEGVSHEERWPVVLARSLSEQGLQIVEPHIIAQTGWTTDELLNALDLHEPLTPDYNLVTLLIGVNNQYRGLTVEQYAREFKVCLSKAIQYAQGHPEHVCVVSIPDWGVSPFAENRDRLTISKQIDQFNAANRELTKQEHAQYADITPLSRLLNNKDHFVEDGLHPSGLVYRKWVQEIQARLSF